MLDHRLRLLISFSLVLDSLFTGVWTSSTKIMVCGLRLKEALTGVLNLGQLAVMGDINSQSWRWDLASKPEL